jgi:hypothetical protein
MADHERRNERGHLFEAEAMTSPNTPAQELIERAAIAKVWPRSVADGVAEHLSPRQIEMLYAASAWAYEAAELLEANSIELERKDAALRKCADQFRFMGDMLANSETVKLNGKGPAIDTRDVIADECEKAEAFARAALSSPTTDPRDAG